jgi:dienelactone hydrolase
VRRVKRMPRAFRLIGVVPAGCAVFAAACSDDPTDGGSSPSSSPAASPGGTTVAPSVAGTTGAAASSTTGSTEVSAGTATQPSPPSTPRAHPEYGVGLREVTFTDTGRPTPRSGDQPATDQRVLETLVFYPSEGEPSPGAVTDAAPAVADGPFPLVVFSHGLGGTPELSQPVIEAWASAGFVVVAPRFPLSRPDNPAGPDAGDVQNQTGDVSFLIDQMLAASADPASPFAALVDGEHIAASGHSNGAITTIGVTLHTCCADDRIDAAIEFAGTASPFAGGAYDWSLAPPYLIVHGTADQLVNYGNAVTLYNNLAGPKALLPMEGGDHITMFLPGTPVFDEVVAASTDFLRAFLLDDRGALDRLADAPDGAVESDYPNLRFSGGDGPVDVIAIVPVAGVDREATVEPTSGLTDGQLVTVTWRGFTPGGSVNVVQCSALNQGAGYCDLTTGKILVANPTGAGSLELEIVVGPVGEATCGPGVTSCVIAINDSGLTEPDATISVPIDFAG